MRNQLEIRKFMVVDGKNRKIPCCSWMPVSPNSQVVLIHGFSEHYRSYCSFAEKCGKKGIAVHSMDLPGHGLADGVRSHIDDFQDYIANVDLLFEVNPNFQKVSTYLFGHSLGGLIASHYCLQRNPKINGLIFTSPLFGFPLTTRPMLYLANILAGKNPDTLFPVPFNVGRLSRNKKSQLFYRSDPYRGHCISPRLLLLMHDYCRRLHDNATDIRLPVLLFMTNGDKIVSIDAIRRFVARCGAEDKTLVAFADAMHELIQEKENMQILDKIHSWITEHN